MCRVIFGAQVSRGILENDIRITKIESGQAAVYVIEGQERLIIGRAPARDHQRPFFPVLLEELLRRNRLEQPFKRASHLSRHRFFRRTRLLGRLWNGTHETLSPLA